MAYTELEARQRILEACHRLVENGLIARTWGNISARLSDTEMMITPSGRAYDTMKPQDLVVVNIVDGSYTGDIKPSSEKGVHADAYRLRPEVNFIVHTHQMYATAVGVSGQDLCMYDKYDPEAARVLGPWIPTTVYGTPGTQKLRDSVAHGVSGNPRSKAFLMPMHGALCLGRDQENAFEVADALERVAEHIVTTALSDTVVPEATVDGGCSVRSGNIFRLTLDGTERIGAVGSGRLHGFAAVHAAIYGHSKANTILFVTDEHIRAFSAEGRKLPSRIDDQVQIAGVGVDSVNTDASAAVLAGRITGRNALLLRGVGAFCWGKDEDDAHAVAMILSKTCLTERYAETVSKPLALSRFEALAQRVVYLTQYSKQKK
jgi:ribulose-5-phosphate 4-epimerase/fuculose-1-phosphate aldolase